MGFTEELADLDRMREQAKRFGARCQYGSIVEADLKSKPIKIKLDDGTEHETHTLIIGTGATAKYIGLESEQKLIGHGVTSCATCDGAFYRDMPVAVVGGGDTAMEEHFRLTFRRNPLDGRTGLVEVTP